MGVEWKGSGDDPDSGPDEELLEQGRPLVPNWVRKTPRAIWAALAFVFLAGAVALVVLSHVGSRPVVRGPVISAPASSNVVAAPDDHLAWVRYLALQPGPLSIYVRSIGAVGGCPLVEPGTSPQQRIIAAVRRVLPRFRVTDVGYVLDPAYALCVLQLRAPDGAGSILVVDVVGPQGQAATGTGDNVTVGAVSDGSTETEYAFAVTHGGWAVTVGSTGPADREPSTKDLSDLAQDPAMHW